VNRASIAHIKAVSASVSSTVNLTKSILFNRTIEQISYFIFTKGVQLAIKKIILIIESSVVKNSNQELKTIAATVINSISLAKNVRLIIRATNTTIASIVLHLTRGVILAASVSTINNIAKKITFHRFAVVIDPDLLGKVVHFKRRVVQSSSISDKRRITKFVKASQQVYMSLISGISIKTLKVIIDIQASVIKKGIQELKTIAFSVMTNSSIHKTIQIARRVNQLNIIKYKNRINKTFAIISHAHFIFTRGIKISVRKIIAITSMILTKTHIKEFKIISFSVATSVKLGRKVRIHIEAIQHTSIHKIKKQIKKTIKYIQYVVVTLDVPRNHYLLLIQVAQRSITTLYRTPRIKFKIISTSVANAVSMSKLIELNKLTAVKTRKLISSIEGSALGRFATGLHTIGYGEYTYITDKFLTILVNTNKTINQRSNISSRKKIALSAARLSILVPIIVTLIVKRAYDVFVELGFRMVGFTYKAAIKTVRGRGLGKNINSRNDNL